MNIFIDTNVYLSFYHLSSDDLEELKKLAVLAREGKITLFLPFQVIDEFKRNRAGKITDALKRMRDQQRPLQLPQLAKQYKEYSKLKDAKTKHDENLSILIERIENDTNSNTLEADAVIKELFKVANIIPVTEEDISLARLRTELGNPPGKKGSIGDAINWEIMLRTVGKKEDIFWVSDDSDYVSPMDDIQFEPYLREEWKEKNQSEILFHRRLSSFFKEEFPDIKLSTELEKDLLINQLAKSSNFASTHNIISKLARYSDFSRSQINEILTASVTNLQVYRILKDPDIKSFINSLIMDKEENFDSTFLIRLKEEMNGEEPNIEIPF